MKHCIRSFSLLLFLLLLCTSCLEIVPPEAENYNNTEEAASPDPVGSTAAPDANKEWLPPITFPEAEPLPAREFDKDEIYRHVFEDQSVELSLEEVEAIEVDTAKGETLISYALNHTESGFEYNKYYHVKHFETETVYETSLKYQAMLFYQTPGVMRVGYIRNDYHEAYLDVMFEHLTFTACEKLPGHQELVYQIGMIYADHGSYYVCSDGYLYYAEKSNETNTYFKSDQKIDAPYLSCVILLPFFYETDRSDVYYQYRTYFNFDETAIEKPSRVEREEDATNYYMEDGSVYKVIDPKWVYVTHYCGFGVGAMSFYVDRTIHYSTAYMLDESFYS